MICMSTELGWGLDEDRHLRPVNIKPFRDTSLDYLGQVTDNKPLVTGYRIYPKKIGETKLCMRESINQ